MKNMIHLEITKEERALLLEVMEMYLSDLRMEIADTDQSIFKEKLKTK